MPHVLSHDAEHLLLPLADPGYTAQALSMGVNRARSEIDDLRPLSEARGKEIARFPIHLNAVAALNGYNVFENLPEKRIRQLERGVHSARIALKGVDANNGIITLPAYPRSWATARLANGIIQLHNEASVLPAEDNEGLGYGTIPTNQILRYIGIAALLRFTDKHRIT